MSATRMPSAGNSILVLAVAVLAAWTQSAPAHIEEAESCAHAPPPRPGLVPPESYQVSLHWRVLSHDLGWASFPWAGQTRRQTLDAWAARVGCPSSLPLSVLESLLFVETALVQNWGKCQGAPPLDAFARWPNGISTGHEHSGTPPLHNEAWPPLALNLALSGDELAQSALLPFLSQRALSTRHFELWSQIPGGGGGAGGPSDDDKERLPLVGAWLLEATRRRWCGKREMRPFTLSDS